MAQVTLSQRYRALAAGLPGINLQSAMNRAAARLRDHIRTTFMGGASTGTRRLARNTGRMENDTVALPATNILGTVRSGVHINVPYASLHFTDTGRRETIIVPRKAKYLTVPILKNAQKRAPKPARDYERTIVIGKTMYSVERNGGLLPIFSLRSSVKVPVRVDVQRDIEPAAKRIMGEEIKAELAKVVK